METRSLIASITKTFTTTLLADMVKQGLVNFDDPIERYLPTNVKVPTYNGYKITLENLATHQDYLIFLLDGLETIPTLLSRSITFFQILHFKVNQEPRLTILILAWVFWVIFFP
jgi:Beta-lactamase